MFRGPLPLFARQGYNFSMNEKGLDNAGLQETELERMARAIEELKAENARLKEENSRLEQLSTYDQLTGILNRRGAREGIELVISSSRTVSPESGEKRHEIEKAREISVIALDIDDFKHINDIYGHEAGDIILRKTAEFLKRTFRKYDIVSRWGGEEFLVAFQGGEQDTINKFFDKEAKLARISFETEVNGEKIEITLSGGVSEYRTGEKLDETIARADKALYESKESGKNRITKYVTPGR